MLTHIAATTLAAQGGGSPINSEWIVHTILQYVIPVILAVIGCMIVANANRGKTSKNATTGVNAVIGIMFIVGAGAFVAFATTITDHVFTG